MPQKTTSIKVATISDIPLGQGKIIQAGKIELALFHIEETYFAIDNNCPHRGAPLGDGYVEGCVVSCPWHGWQFDIKTGSLLMNPAEKLKTFPVSIKGKNIYVEV